MAGKMPMGSGIRKPYQCGDFSPVIPTGKKAGVGFFAVHSPASLAITKCGRRRASLHMDWYFIDTYPLIQTGDRL